MKLQGKVLWYDKKKNVGVIQENEGYQHSVSGGDLIDLNYLDAGDLVEFERETRDGKLCAVSVVCEEVMEEECSHEEHDHFVCIDCGEELDPGTFIDAAMDKYEER
jgi:cold shock CspA family protein